MTDYEIGYVGSYANRMTFTAAIYRNETEDSIDEHGRHRFGAASRALPRDKYGFEQVAAHQAYGDEIQ